jgi:hypothetical protein
MKDFKLLGTSNYYQGPVLLKVKKYTFMFAAEGDLAVLQTALFCFSYERSYLI